MIIYFTGTGNSRFVAETMAATLQDEKGDFSSDSCGRQACLG